MGARFFGGVRDGDGEGGAAHKWDVCNVVADDTCLCFGDAGGDEDFTVFDDLVVRPLPEMFDTEVAGAAFEGGGGAPGDDGGLEAGAVEEDEAVAVAGVKAFLLVVAGDERDPPVGEDAVAVEQQEFNAGRPPPDFRVVNHRH